MTRELISLEHEWDIRSVDWPQLTSESVVVEVGGFHGRWAQHIQERYHPRLFVFEPQTWLIPELQERLPEVTICNYGLWSEDIPDAKMTNYGTDGASFVTFDDVRQPGTGNLREIRTAFDELGITHVDVMLVNIEGGEHFLIPHMFQQGIKPAIIMLQLHELSGLQGALILAGISNNGYTNLWDYGGFTLSAWQRKEVRR